MSHFMQVNDQNHRKFHISGNLEPVLVLFCFVIILFCQNVKPYLSLYYTIFLALMLCFLLLLKSIGLYQSNQGSLKGSLNSTNSLVGMFDKMKLQESSYGSNIGTSTYHQSLSQDQIRAIELSRLKQEQILSLKQKLFAYRESHDRILPNQYEPNEEIMQFQKKWKGVGVGKRRTRTIRHGPMSHRTVSGSASTATSCGTGVFLPRAGTDAPSGKGCSTVLIPARVVQALQHHFDQIGVMPGPKVAGFPPLQDVIVSNKDGMYSLQNRKANIQNEMILPQEWTY